MERRRFVAWMAWLTGGVIGSAVVLASAPMDPIEERIDDASHEVAMPVERHDD